MTSHLALSLFLLGGLIGENVWAQEAREVAMQSANRAFQAMSALDANGGSNEGAIRRCRAYMNDALSSDKLGAKDMALRNWNRAARGCRADAVTACRERKTGAAEYCESIARQASR